MATNRNHPIIPHLNEHDVSLAMIKILEEQRISNEDLRTMDRDDVEHLFKNSMGFTFRDRKQFWNAIQKIRSSPPTKVDVIYVEPDNEIPDVYDATDNQPPTRVVPASRMPLRPVETVGVLAVAKPPEIPKSVEVSRPSFVETGMSIYELTSSEDEMDTVQIATTSLPPSNQVPHSTETSNDIFVFPVQLPTFSWPVLKALESNNISSEWTTLAHELALWIYSKKQKTLTKSEFQAVGRTVFTLYPCIAKDGFRPWSHLCRCITRQMRKLKSRLPEPINIAN